MIALIGGPGSKDEKPSFGKKFGREEESEESESGPSLMGMGRKRYAKDILGAIEAGDAGALDKALAAHYEACTGAEEE